VKVLCVFGQYQYGNEKRGLGTEYGAFVPALERLGHDVLLFDSWHQQKWTSHAALNEALLDLARRARPALMLFVPYLYEVWIETLDAIRAEGIPVACWTTDDSWKYDQSSRFLAPHVDAIATTYASVVPKYHADRIEHVILSQWAASSAALAEPLPAANCRYPISFVGTANAERRKRVEELAQRGVAVECFGHGWPRGAVAAEEIPRIIRGSVISLNFATSYGENQIKARTFEVPGAGGFLLTDPAADLERFYRIGEEIEVYRDLDELAAKAKHYLADSAARDRIARAGHERTRREHTYEQRLTELIDFALQRKNLQAIELPAFDEAMARHTTPLPMRAIRSLMLGAASLVWGRERGYAAARRLVYEISWRLAGAKTYRASGWPGRMYPRYF
jgi:spore maturation protein CgeB